MGPTVRYVIKVLFTLALSPFKIFPIKNNKVFLFNDLNGKDANYSSNPKYIAEYLIDHHQGEYEIIYPLGEKWNKPKIQGIKFIKLRSLKYYYHALTSKFFITTSGGISYMPFKKNQVVINSWHGGGAFKKMGLDAIEDIHLKKALQLSEKKTDYFISSNEYFSKAIQTAFLIPQNKILEYGLPRNDVIINKKNHEEIESKVKSSFNIPKTKNIVLYAPTYRSPEESIFKKHTVGPYDIDYNEVLKALKRKFGGDWIFAIRLHPSISDCSIKIPENIINMSNYEDPQELFIASSVLINDYSSTMWDFSFTRKPCFIYASDMDSYNFNLGFYTTPQEWPFPLAKNNRQLIKEIMDFDYDSYMEQLDCYYHKLGNYDRGDSLVKLVKLMKEEGVS